MAVALDEYLVQIITGLARGSLLFLIASGLTLIFGALRVINFAHGSLYMLGAYITVWLTPAGGLENVWFWLVFLAAALLVGAGGAVLEVALFRPIYDRSLLVQFLVTFSIIFVVAGILREFFGAGTRTTSVPPLFDGAVEVLGARVPAFNFAFISVAVAVAALLWTILYKTTLGRLIRAVVSDSELLRLTGVNVDRLRTGVFVLAAFFAGLAGAVATLSGSVSPNMAFDSIISAFVVVIIGGLGSLPGAFLAAMLVGVAEALGILWVPRASIAIVFVVLVAVLALRPQGLMGARAR